MCIRDGCYTARNRNLMISAGMLLFQVVLSLVLIFAMRAVGWPPAYQAAGPAVALMVSLALTSVLKAGLLQRILAAPVSPLRWPLLWAALASGVVGWSFTRLPHELEWAELVIGEPAMLAVYLLVLWRWAFGPDDRALLMRGRPAEPAQG